MVAEIVSVVNQKGGTGKTTTTMNLGCALASLGKRVLLVDLDPQANLSYSLGVAEPDATIVDVMTEERPIHEAIVQSGGVDILPGSADMANIEISLVGQEQREYFLRECLDQVRGEYDYILIDSPPSLSMLTVNSLTAADSVLIPMQLEVLSLQGLSQILNTVSQIRNAFNPKLRVKGIALVMYDRRRKLSQELLQFMQDNIDSPIFSSAIRLNVKIAEAPSFGQSVIGYDEKSHGARDYMALAREFAGADNAKPSRKKKAAKVNAVEQ